MYSFWDNVDNINVVILITLIRFSSMCIFFIWNFLADILIEGIFESEIRIKPTYGKYNPKYGVFALLVTDTQIKTAAWVCMSIYRFLHR